MVKHNIRCELAKRPICRCKCSGVQHGIAVKGLDKVIGEKYMTLSMGGEVEEVIKKLQKIKKFTCSCQHEILLVEFKGYPHDGGLVDREGKKWFFTSIELE